MSENITALVVILVLATGVFWLAGKAYSGTASDPRDFSRRRNLWFGITIVAFLAPNFWLYIFVTAIMLAYSQAREKNWLAMFCLLLFVVPQIPGRVPALGLVNYLFTIDIYRLIGLVVLLPAFLSLRRRDDAVPFGATLPDKLLLGYLILRFAMLLRATTVTDALRGGILYGFLDVYLPYYVVSRQAVTIREFRDALAAFTTAALLLAIVGVFENLKHWLLYFNLSYSLAGAQPYGWMYLVRGESIRASASVGQPIPMGLVLILGLAFLFYLRRFTRSPMVWWAALAILCAGLLATVSRGPWIGAIAMFIVFVATGPAATSNVFKTMLAGAVVLAIILASPMGPKFIDLIPFVGNVEPQNAEYRKLFVQQSLLAISHHPWFGSPDFANAPEFAQLKPQGLLDTLNVFIAVALESGLVGLALYGGIFVTVGFGVLRSSRSQRGVDDELYLVGRALLAAFAGLFVTINTISPITIIPLVYWCMMGLGVGYILLVRRIAGGRAVPVRSTRSVRRAHTYR
jgi:O-antigen ligase